MGGAVEDFISDVLYLNFIHLMVGNEVSFHFLDLCLLLFEVVVE